MRKVTSVDQYHQRQEKKLGGNGGIVKNNDGMPRRRVTQTDQRSKTLKTYNNRGKTAMKDRKIAAYGGNGAVV